MDCPLCHSVRNSYSSFPSLLHQTLFCSIALLSSYSGPVSTYLCCFLPFFSSMALSSLILSYLSIFLIFPNRSLTTNATVYNKLLIVDFACFSLHYPIFTFFSNENTSLVLLFSTSLILNSIACCSSSVRFLCCNSSPSFVMSDSAASMLSYSVSLMPHLCSPA